MTRINQTPHGATARFRRFAGGLLVVGAVFAVTISDGVDARPRSKSEVVAAEADRALASLASWEATQDPTDYVRFLQAREATATLTAIDLEIDPAQLRREWAEISAERQQAILAAMSQLGVPYRYLKSQPDVGFDCSGLTIWAFEQAGIEIPRNSRDQFRASDEVDDEMATAGDLVYYPGHIAIYIGAGSMVHSPNTGSHVEAVTLSTQKRLRFGDAVTPALSDAAKSAAESLSTTLVDRSARVS